MFTDYLEGRLEQTYRKPPNLFMNMFFWCWPKEKWALRGVDSFLLAEKRGDGNWLISWPHLGLLLFNSSVFCMPPNELILVFNP